LIAARAEILERNEFDHARRLTYLQYVRLLSGPA